MGGQLQNKLENALNEARILILGGQVLIGAAFRLTFMDGFDRLPLSSRGIHIGSLWIMLMGLGVLLAPASYHFIVENGANTGRFHELVTTILEWTLLPFALGLGVSTFLVGEITMSISAGAVVGAFIFSAALSVWYVFSALKAKRRPKPLPEQEPTKLTEKIKEALIELRMILPGAQALLGFQVANTFTNSFDRLPRTSQWSHLGSLLCIAISIIFLMAPAAFHRIAENGEDSEEFYELSGRMLLSAMFWLGLGIAADLWVIVRRTAQSESIAWVSSAATLIFFYAIWFGYSTWKSRQNVRERLAS
jgi:hypothetical protein